MTGPITIDQHHNAIKNVAFQRIGSEGRLEWAYTYEPGSSGSGTSVTRINERARIYFNCNNQSASDNYLESGRVVQVLEVKGVFAKVKTVDGKAMRGWVLRQYIDE